MPKKKPNQPHVLKTEVPNPADTPSTNNANIRTFPGEIHTDLTHQTKTLFPTAPSALAAHASLHNSISEEAKRWRIFSEENNAIRCARELWYEHGVLPFMFYSFEGHPLYLVTHPLELRLRTPFLYTYEIIPDDRISKLYLELSFDRTLNPQHDGEKITDIFLRILFCALKNEYGIDLEACPLLTLDACSDRKFHRQLVFQSPLLFPSTKQIDVVVGHVCFLIRDALRKQESKEKDRKRREARAGHSSKKPKVDAEIITLFGIPAPELEMLQVKLSDGELVLVVNEQAYSNNYKLLVYGHRGFATTRILSLSPRNTLQTQPQFESMKEEMLLLACLATFTTQILITLPELTVEPVNRPRHNNMASDDSKSGSKAISPWPQLECFIFKRVAPCTIDAVLHYLSSHTYVYSTKEAGFCENIGRFHSRNRIMYVVDYRKGVYRQKCHDPDCKNFDFPWKSLPDDVRKAIIEGDGWDFLISPDEICAEYERRILDSECSANIACREKMLDSKIQSGVKVEPMEEEEEESPIIVEDSE